MDNSNRTHNKIEEGFVGQQMFVLPPDKRKKITGSKLSRNLYPTAIGFYPHASYHDRERLKGCPEYILLYCIDGNGWIEIEGSKHRLIPNTFFILPKDIPHHYGSSQKDPWSIYWIHFAGEHAPLLYFRNAESSGKSVVYVAYDEIRVQVFKELFHAVVDDLTQTRIELVYIKLLQFLSSLIYTNVSYRPEENDVVDRSIAFMKDNLKKSCQIKELASNVNYSVSHYSELFRKKTGCAPIQYLIQLKIQKSCQYLYFTKLNIKEICVEVGFDDPYYFSRMFKKLLGQSPQQYRKQHKS